MEIVFSYLLVAGATHYHIITAARTALDGFTVSKAEGSKTSIKRYFIIKRTLFMFKKKFATTDNRRKYYYCTKEEKEGYSQH